MKKDKKISTPYKVRTITKAIKDLDLEKRVVTGLFNSCFYIDSDLDMVLPGAASKSISERGVGSTSGNKIKHLKDHDWSKNIARLDVLDERTVEIEGKEITGIYHESYYPESQDSTDMLIKLQAGLYDARSIGYQYEKLVFCTQDTQDNEGFKNWNTYLPMAINPEVAQERGYFWVVKELRLWEGSDVSFGANELTPMLGLKGAAKDIVIKQMFDKLDTCLGLFKSGNLSDEGFHRLEMEMKQIKSYIATITKEQPPKGSTEDDPSRQPKSTSAVEFFKHL